MTWRIERHPCDMSDAELERFAWQRPLYSTRYALKVPRYGSREAGWRKRDRWGRMRHFMSLRGSSNAQPMGEVVIMPSKDP